MASTIEEKKSVRFKAGYEIEGVFYVEAKNIEEKFIKTTKEEEALRKLEPDREQFEIGYGYSSMVIKSRDDVIELCLLLLQAFNYNKNKDQNGSNDTETPF